MTMTATPNTAPSHIATLIFVGIASPPFGDGIGGSVVVGLGEEVLVV